MKRFFAVSVFFLVCSSCATKPQPIHSIPPMPPKPSTSATSGAIAAAAVDTVAAQSNVRAGRDRAKADDAPAAVPLLDKADSQLTDALTDLDAAKNHAADLEGKIVADRAAHEAQVTSYTAQAKDLNTQLLAAAAANKKLAKENADLKSSVIRNIQYIIGGIGGALLLAAAGFTAAWLWLNMVNGWKAAAVCATVGGTALSMAVMLKVIVWTFIAGLGVAVVAALAYAAWHLWKDSRDTLNNVVAGVQSAKENMPPDSVDTLKRILSGVTTDADKVLIELLKPKVP